MIITNFHFTNSGGWIEYIQDGQTMKESFDTAESLHKFINDNNIPLTYSGCLTCQ